MDVGLWIDNEDRFEDFCDPLYDKFTDFRVYSNDGIHRDVHRIVLAKRTGFFRKLFMEDPVPTEYRFKELNYTGVMVCIEAIYSNSIHVEEGEITDALIALKVMKINCWIRWDSIYDSLTKDRAIEEGGQSTSSSGELPADTVSARPWPADTESLVTTADNSVANIGDDCPTETYSQTASARSEPSGDTKL